MASVGEYFKAYPEFVNSSLFKYLKRTQIDGGVNMTNNCGCGNSSGTFDYFMNITPALPGVLLRCQSSEQRIKSMCLEI